MPCTLIALTVLICSAFCSVSCLFGSLETLECLSLWLDLFDSLMIRLESCACEPVLLYTLPLHAIVLPVWQSSDASFISFLPLTKPVAMELCVFTDYHRFSFVSRFFVMTALDATGWLSLFSSWARSCKLVPF